MFSIPLEHSVPTSVQSSARVMEVAAMFGLGVDETRVLQIVPRCEIPLPHLSGRRGIVFITGLSGSGKSTLLRLIAQQCRSDTRVLRFDAMPPLPDLPLVDALDASGMLGLEQLMSILAMVGLSDAFVMLRTPSELSDGQRYRMRLAQMIAAMVHDDAQRSHNDRRASPGAVVLADEFGATLDRITAQTIARNLRRWVDARTASPRPAASVPLSFICATTHDDLLEALAPDVLVWKGLGQEICIMQRSPA